MAKAKEVCLLVILSVGLLSLLVGFSTHRWIEVVGKYNDDSEEGLWQRCDRGGGSCRTIGIKVPDWLNAVRALACIALLAYIFALGAAIAYVFGHKKSILLKAIRGVFLKALRGGSLAVAVSVLMASAVYGDKTTDYHLHYSFALFVCGGVLALAAIIFTCVFHFKGGITQVVHGL